MSGDDVKQNADMEPLEVEIYNKYDMPLPQRKSPKAAAFDIYAPEQTYIPHLATRVVDTGLIIKPPEGWHYEVRLRSGIAADGLMLNTAVGLIDQGYCGPEDFLFLPITNVSASSRYEIPAESRVAQIVFVEDCPPVHWNERGRPTFARGESRGGFGSTGLS